MAQIAVGVMSKLVLMREELEEEEEEMVGWSIVAGMFGEWTDGRKVVGGELAIDAGSSSHKASIETEEPHILLTTEILERVLTSGCSSKYFPFPYLPSPSGPLFLQYSCILGVLEIE